MPINLSLFPSICDIKLIAVYDYFTRGWLYGTSQGPFNCSINYLSFFISITIPNIACSNHNRRRNRFEGIKRRYFAGDYPESTKFQIRLYRYDTPGTGKRSRKTKKSTNLASLMVKRPDALGSKVYRENVRLDIIDIDCLAGKWAPTSTGYRVSFSCCRHGF